MSAKNSSMVKRQNKKKKSQTSRTAQKISTAKITKNDDQMRPKKDHVTFRIIIMCSSRRRRCLHLRQVVLNMKTHKAVSDQVSIPSQSNLYHQKKREKRC
jgi:hypothetical protein